MANNCELKLADATIGIITALPKELAAVRKVFSCTAQIFAGEFGNRRSYWLAGLDSSGGGNHAIAIGLLVDMGNNMAAIRVTQLFNDCENIQYVFMVGIAGAVPSPDKAEDHVRLGDIVISDRYGVVQYDYGKKNDDGFEHKNAPRAPSADLLAIVKSLQADELLGNRSWEDSITNVIEEDSQWARPSEEHDCLIDNGKEIEHPPDPERRADSPKIFLGPIASGNIVLKNALDRNALQEKFKVKAVEMEGAGVADAAWSSNVGYIIVRGTSDYCNKGKNDKWQNYAALIAAAYTRTIIECVPASSHNGPKGKEQQRGTTESGIRAENVQIFNNCQILYPSGAIKQNNNALVLSQENFKIVDNVDFDKDSADSQNLGVQSERALHTNMTTFVTSDEVKQKILPQNKKSSIAPKDKSLPPKRFVEQPTEKTVGVDELFSEKGQRLLKELQSYMMEYEHDKAFAMGSQVETWLAECEDKLSKELTIALYEQLAKIELTRATLKKSRGETFDLSKVHFFINKAKKIKNE